MRKRIKAFDGVRVLAFLGVFLSHLPFETMLACNNTGINGVSIFIIMSGFLMAYGHEENWKTKVVWGGNFMLLV